MKGRNLLRGFLVYGALAVVGSCKEVVAPVPVASVGLSATKLEMVPGESTHLTAVVTDDAGEPLERTITWTSSAPSVAAVDNGLITAVAPGTATITATSEGKFATASVSIEDGGIIGPAGGTIRAIGGVVELSIPAAAVVSPSRLFVRAATQFPENARLVHGTAFELSNASSSGSATQSLTTSLSSFTEPAMLTIRYNPADLGGKPESTLSLFALVDSHWKQIDKSEVNTANHTVSGRMTSLGVYAVFVEAGVASVAIDPGNATIGVGQSTKLAATALDDASAPLSGRSIAWTTSDASIATVDASTGEVTGVAPGSATITAKSENVSGTATVRVSAGAATRIRSNDGDGQIAAASSPVAIPPSVIVTDAAGFPVSGVSVTFTVTAGGGSVSGGAATTNDAGIARVGSWTLGSSGGPNALTASASGLDGNPVVFGATAQKTSPPSGDPVSSGPPASISIFAGDNQTALPNTAVPIAPAVKVSDAAGVGVTGVSVIFSIRSGEGSITGAVAVSDAKGIATLGKWVLGPGGGNSLFATLNGVSGSPLIFVAFASINAPPPPPPPPPPCSPGTAAAISIFAGDNQTAPAGSAVAIRPAVKATNSAGQGVCGVTVTFSIRSGDGTLTGANAVTNESGIATLGSWTLGSIGGNSLFATLNGAAGSPLIFVASATPGAGSSVRIVTFGDSNTDAGYAGSTFVVSSYVSSGEPRMPASGGNSPYQLAGKIEARWSALNAKPITAVNHAISATTTGTGRSPRTAPNAREAVGGVTRFEGEVLGSAYPWSGGETQSTAFYPAGPIARVRAFSPGVNDFVYVSMGTNDAAFGVAPDEIAANLSWMIDMWVNSGHAANHFILTTLPPNNNGTNAVPLTNNLIRSLAAARGVRLVDIAARTSNDNGFTWRSSADVVPDGSNLHYTEAVRDWIADQVVSIMIALVPN